MNLMVTPLTPKSTRKPKLLLFIVVYLSHIHWVPRLNKLEIPNDEEEVNTREIYKCDGQAHDPDTMVTPLTPNPTRKTEVLVKSPTSLFIMNQ